jgi:hypothetical protein
VTETKGIDQSLLLEAPSTWRLLLTRLHRDAGGNPEWFEIACAVKSALHDERHLESVRTRHRRAEPFLRGWQGAMNHWASYNCDVLKKSLCGHVGEPDRALAGRPISDSVLVAPASPARPALSLPVLRRLGLSPDLHWSSLSTL